MNILLIALHYHDYTAQIAAELRALGHRVSVHDIQPRDVLMKALRVTSPLRWQARLDAHHGAILKLETGKTYDVVMFVQVHQMRREMLDQFRENFTSARFILYNWDAITQHDYRPYLDAFDVVATFDPDDARRYDLLYLPLFCVRDFQRLERRQQNHRGVYFIGNIVNPARYEAVRQFSDYCSSENIPLKTWLACSPIVQLRLIRSGIMPRGVSTGSVSKSRFVAMIETSTAVFDFANHHQSGYTMRVIENLCAGKKIITNNARVEHESFYSPDRVHVFTGTSFAGVSEFLQQPLDQPDEDFVQFHVQNFVQHLLDARGHALPRILPGSATT